MRAAALACVGIALAGVAAFADAPAGRAEPTLAAVLERAAAYVAEYQLRLSRIVAEERYVQDWSTVGPKGRTFARRDLRSDLALIKAAGAESWAEFRDILEVDGRVIRARDDHLEAAMRAPASMHISTVLEESARLNLGDIERNVNTPIFPLRVLEARNQPRFRFERTTDATPMPAATADRPSGTVFRASTEVWVIAYREVQTPTLIRTARRTDQRARGRFWIEPATGRVFASELIFDDRAVRATVDVSYQFDPDLDMLVPAVMHERCEGRKTWSVVEGRATYGRFRRVDP